VKKNFHFIKGILEEVVALSEALVIKHLGPLYPNGKAKGGEISILGSANLITPAFFFDNNEKMRMSAFIDAGNIFEKSSNIKLDDLRMSTGLDLLI
jgi:outer membrane protein insertion porin family